MFNFKTLMQQKEDFTPKVLANVRMRSFMCS